MVVQTSKAAKSYEVEEGAGVLFAPEPTVAPKEHGLRALGMPFTAVDLPGDKASRGVWHEHMARATGVVFVVDSADDLRMPVAREELWAFW